MMTGFTRANKRNKCSINITRDSMTRHITKIMKCSNQGSGCIAKEGKGITEIIMKSQEKCKRIQDEDYLIVQRGSNSLKWLSVDATI